MTTSLPPAPVPAPVAPAPVVAPNGAAQWAKVITLVIASLAAGLGGGRLGGEPDGYAMVKEQAALVPVLVEKCRRIELEVAKQAEIDKRLAVIEAAVLALPQRLAALQARLDSMR